MIDIINNKLPNIYKYNSLKRGIWVVVKKDYLFISNSNNQITLDTNDDLNDRTHNIYRGQLGLCYGPTPENPEKYTVLFRDKDADPISFAEGINQLEVEKDDVIPLLLPDLDNPELHLVEKCYSDPHYQRRSTKSTKKLPLRSFIVELPQPQSETPRSINSEDEDAYSELNDKSDDTYLNPYYEMVSCYETHMFIHHNETENQFNPNSLVTVQDVCHGIYEPTFHLYPGQVGKIIEPCPLEDSDSPVASDDYVKVIFLPFTLAKWNNVDKCPFIENKDHEYQIKKLKELEEEENWGVIIYINKYNLVPIFQTKLTLASVGKIQVQQIQKFSEMLKNCTKEQYKAQLKQWFIDNNLSDEDSQQELVERLEDVKFV